MIEINGKQFVGDNVTIRNGQVIIGKEKIALQEKIVNVITINGNLKSLDVDHATTIDIKGSVTNIRNGSGDLTCGDVLNSLQSGSGDVTTNSIIGSITTGSGDVTAVDIRGNIKTGSGDVTCKNNYGNIVL